MIVCILNGNINDTTLMRLLATWFDHPRDLLHFINVFRSEIQRPIIGIGHSMGGNNLVNLALMHPRLIHSLILIDPVIQSRVSVKGNFAPAASSALRREVWPSRTAAAASFKKSKFYQTWDPRVLDLWVKYGLRELPTELFPGDQTTPSGRSAAGAGKKPTVPLTTAEPTSTPFPAEVPVTLTTTKHQEVLTFLRSNFPPDPNSTTPPPPIHVTHPDLDPSDPQQPFYRSEAHMTFNNLPFLRPSVFYMFGSLSHISAKMYRDEKMEHTGTALGGSGGVAAGRVSSILLEGLGHLIPMEDVGKTAVECQKWMEKELQRFREEEKILADIWDKTPEDERFRLSKKALNWFAEQRRALAPAAAEADPYAKPKL